MLKKIAIDNFKAFSHFEMDDLPLVSLVSGRNGVGKSTLLEAIFFNYCLHRPDMLDIAQVDRALRFPPFYLLPHLFYGQDTEKVISLAFESEGPSSVTTCSLTKTLTVATTATEKEERPAATNARAPLTTLKIEKKTTFQGDTETQHATFTFESPENGHYKGTWTDRFTLVSFINSFNAKWPVEEMFSRLQDKKREEDLLASMRKIAPNLERFRVAVEGGQTIIKCGLSGIDNDVPLGYMGEGVVRAFTVLLLVLSSDSEIMLVDEVENGIHYSAVKDIWKAILVGAKEQERQMFLTTHSYECICAAVTACEELGLGDEDFAFYRLKGEGGGNVRASRYGHDQLAAALDANWEVR